MDPPAPTRKKRQAEAESSDSSDDHDTSDDGMKSTRKLNNLYPQRRPLSSHTPNGDGERKSKNKNNLRPRRSPRAKNASSTMARVPYLHPTSASTPKPKQRPKSALRTIPDARNIKIRCGSGTCLFGRLKTPSGGSLMALGRSRGFICRCDAEIRCKARTWGVCFPLLYPLLLSPSTRPGGILYAILYGNCCVTMYD
jgi:hypothetical protein